MTTISNATQTIPAGQLLTEQAAESSNPSLLQKNATDVNDRGGQASDLPKKIVFCVIVGGLLFCGAAYTFQKVMNASKAEKAQKAQSEKAQNTSAQGVNRRVFTSDPAAVPGGTSQPLLALDAEGHPVSVPVVPGIGATEPPLAGRGVTTGGNAPVHHSRYGGDVMVPPSGGTSYSTASPTTGSGNASTLVQDILNRTLGNNGGAAGTTNLGGNGGAGYANSLGSGGGATPTALGGMLTPTQTPMVSAAKLGDRNMILPKGRSVDCVLTTRLSSEVPGMTSCVLTSNVYSDNGRVVLLERGSEASGEYSATMQQGQRRIFVLWSRIKTPNGVLINLNSPGTDSLGTAGLNGEVDNRWTERIGAAFLLSIVQDAIGYEVAKTTASNGNATGAVFEFQNTSRTGDQMAQRVLDSTINIKPTLTKNQGERISIFVARDLDFGSVYALRAQ